MHRSRLELARLYRPYQEFGGAFRSERESLDFVIDGHRLSTMIGGDPASRLGLRKPGYAKDQQYEEQIVNRLLLKGSPDFPPNRFALYVCPECADFGCGTLTAAIERNGDIIVWRDFGWQTDYEDVVHRDEYARVGPFHFDADEYERVLHSSLQMG